MVSVIIPVYNEEKSLTHNLPYFKKLADKSELIFVDGKSSDQTREIAKECGKVFTAPKGRAGQMNYGSRFSGSEFLLFLHADSRISPGILDAVEEKLNSGFIGGCLTQKIDNRAFIYRLLELLGNIRARLTRVFYGDQGIFVRKDIFRKLNGFPALPIMEDVIFSRKLRHYGKTVCLPGKIIVSARRWEREGVFKTMLLHSLITFMFWLKIPLSKISSLYGDLR